MNETQRARLEGAAAYTRGVQSDHNPYPSSDGLGELRISWFDGWYDARIARKLGPIFERNKMTWPPTPTEMKEWRKKQIQADKRKR